MKKSEMVTKTMEGFIRKLEEEGMSKYASELRSIVAMSRKRREAIIILTGIEFTLLLHMIKFMFMPEAKDRSKWRREIQGYLSQFNRRNRNPKNQPWLSLEYIQEDLNETLADPEFLKDLKRELEDYPDEPISKIMGLLRGRKTLKSLGIKLSFDDNGSLVVSVNGQPI